MTEYEMQILFRPLEKELRFLPEGPYPYQAQSLSWVAIQHAATSTSGSLNLFDLSTHQNRRFPLPGRPGFAFPTSRTGVFVIGLERHLTLFDTQANTSQPLSPEVDAHVAGTVINDGVAFAEGIVFGCKDLKFSERKAGLYLWRKADHSLIQLRHDQTCSNGKVIIRDGSLWSLYDIDTPTKGVVRYTLDVAAGKLSEPEIVLDLRACVDFPDGMIGTPDGRSVIISFYNPGDAPAGETRQYSLATGKLEAVWKTPLSPQATCPQLIRLGDKIHLVVTTAVEHMPPERLEKYPNAGCLFICETGFSSLPETPVVEL